MVRDFLRAGPPPVNGHGAPLPVPGGCSAGHQVGFGVGVSSRRVKGFSCSGLRRLCLLGLRALGFKG